jgi:hypothetical protein
VAGDPAPKGELEFQDHGTGLNFHAKDMTALGVAGCRATFAGIGTVNGVAGYRFESCVFDAGEPSKKGDTFAIRIFAPNGSVLYQTGYDVEPDELSGGNIQVHGCQ